MSQETEKVRKILLEERLRRFSSILYPIPPTTPTNNIDAYIPNIYISDYYDVYSIGIDKSYVLSLFQGGNYENNKYCRAIMVRTHLEGREQTMYEFIQTIYSFLPIFYNIRKFTNIVPHSSIIISTSHWTWDILPARTKIIEDVIDNLVLWGVVTVLFDGPDGNYVTRLLNSNLQLDETGFGMYVKVDSKPKPPIRMLGLP